LMCDNSSTIKLSKKSYYAWTQQTHWCEVLFSTWFNSRQSDWTFALWFSRSSGWLPD
jgi:hypothetical protein